MHRLYLSTKPSFSGVLLLLLTSPSALLPVIEKLLSGITFAQQQQQQRQKQQQQQQSCRSLALLAQMSSDPPLRAHSQFMLLHSIE